MRRLLANDAFWLAMIASTLAQIFKVFHFWRQTGEFDWTRMYETGGMPSSHSAMVSALATAVGLAEGLDSPYFAIATILAVIVVYDSAGIRRAAGTHARVLNQIIAELLQGHPIGQVRLKELLGHTRMEVTVGVLLGVGLSSGWLLVLKPIVCP